MIELEGPRVTFDEAAGAISLAIGGKTAHVRVTPADARAALRQTGMSEDAAKRVVEIYEALETGVLGGEPPSIRHVSTTSLDVFAREVFLPAYRASA